MRGCASVSIVSSSLDEEGRPLLLAGSPHANGRRADWLASAIRPDKSLVLIAPAPRVTRVIPREETYPIPRAVRRTRTRPVSDGSCGRDCRCSSCEPAAASCYQMREPLWLMHVRTKMSFGRSSKRLRHTRRPFSIRAPFAVSNGLRRKPFATWPSPIDRFEMDSSSFRSASGSGAGPALPRWSDHPSTELRIRCQS